MKRFYSILAVVVMLAGLAAPAMARIEGYGGRNFNAVGRGGFRGGRGHGGTVVIDRRRGPGWGGAAAAGLIGAAAGLAIGSAIAPPVVAGPPVMGTMIPSLPGGCVPVPSVNGAPIYDCGGIYYSPVYQGYSMMYQAVPGP